MRHLPLAVLAICAIASPLAAQEAEVPDQIVNADPLVPESTLDEGEALPENPYYDDRSTAAAVIESVYNAINRNEYLRAWSYFDHSQFQGDEAALLADFEAFAQGYAQTDSVQLLVGPETTEGTAGTVYYRIPVAIEATANDGTIESFAGCYTLKLTQPSLQEVPPFAPLVITEGDLVPLEGQIDAILPSACQA